MYKHRNVRKPRLPLSYWLYIRHVYCLCVVKIYNPCIHGPYFGPTLALHSHYIGRAWTKPNLPCTKRDKNTNYRVRFCALCNEQIYICIFNKYNGICVMGSLIVLSSYVMEVNCTVECRTPFWANDYQMKILHCYSIFEF